MTITATDAERCNQVISGGIRMVQDYREMLDALCEGDFGHAFGLFYHTTPQLGGYVVKDAIQKFQANRTKWVGPEHFTANYHVQVIKWSNYPLGASWNKVDMQGVWEMYAEMIREFATGE